MFCFPSINQIFTVIRAPKEQRKKNGKKMHNKNNRCKISPKEVAVERGGSKHMELSEYMYVHVVYTISLSLTLVEQLRTIEEIH